MKKRKIFHLLAVLDSLGKSPKFDAVKCHLIFSELQLCSIIFKWLSRVYLLILTCHLEVRNNFQVCRGYKEDEV